MKAVVCTEYNSLEHIKVSEVSDPQITGPNDIIIRVVCSTVQTADWRVRTLEMPAGMTNLARLIFGWQRPRQPVLGTEFSGVVDKVGANVQEIGEGDAVVGTNGGRFGAHAELCKVKRGWVLCKIPPGLSFAAAASIPFGGLTALDFLRNRAQLRPQEKVLVLGASGAVGVAAVQIATVLGAHVTAVCSKQNFSWLQPLGAQDLIDYNTQDIARCGKTFDVVVDPVGLWSLGQLRNLTRSRGRILLVSAGLVEMLRAPFLRFHADRQAFAGLTSESSPHLEELLNWTVQGKFQPIIDSIHTMENAAEAHKRVATRHKRGSVLLSFGSTQPNTVPNPRDQIV